MELNERREARVAKGMGGGTRAGSLSPSFHSIVPGHGDQVANSIAGASIALNLPRGGTGDESSWMHYSPAVIKLIAGERRPRHRAVLSA